MATKYESPEIQALGDQWAAAKKAGASQDVLDAIHNAAENLRKNQGYESTNGWGNDFVSTTTGKKYKPNYQKETLEEYGNVKELGYDNAEKWKDEYVKGLLAQLDQKYNTDVANLLNTYKQNYALGENELGRITADFQKNMNHYYDNVYSQRKMAMQNAGRNGGTSTAQALAASNASLYQAADKVADMATDKSMIESEIRRELNNLTQAYNNDKIVLEKNFNSAKIDAMSDGELKYLEAVLGIDKYNADLWNSLSSSMAEREWQSAEADKDRLWQSSEAQKDRDFKLSLESLYGSGSGYGYGDPSKSNDNDTDVSDLAYALEYETQNVPKSEVERFAAMLIGVENGRYKKSDVAALINNTIKKYNYAANNPDWAHKNNVSSLTNSYDKYITSQIR